MKEIVKMFDSDKIRQARKRMRQLREKIDDLPSSTEQDIAQHTREMLDSLLHEGFGRDFWPAD